MKRIDPYTGLPPRRKVKFQVVSDNKNPGFFVIVDTKGSPKSKPLTKPQLEIATQHTINAASSNRDGSIDDLGQALVNFKYESGQGR